eukprot:ANDGO_01857.mRNA.1 Putative glutaminase 3
MTGKRKESVDHGVKGMGLAESRDSPPVPPSHVPSAPHSASPFLRDVTTSSTRSRSHSISSRIDKSADLAAFHLAQMEALYESIASSHADASTTTAASGASVGGLEDTSRRDSGSEHHSEGRMIHSASLSSLSLLSSANFIPVSEPKVLVRHVVELLAEMGIDAFRDSRISGIFAQYAGNLSAPLQLEEFVALLNRSFLIERAMNRNLAIPEWSSFCDELVSIFEKVAARNEGDVARYIPQLARVNPDQMGLAVCSIDGQRFSHGDARVPFCAQSCSKVISYCIALEELGQSEVHKYVGREPSGRNFNELVLNKDNLPHNPYINSGAIMTTSLIRNQSRLPDRITHVLSTWSCLAGDSRIGFDNATYLSEASTADRNFTLGYMMKEAGKFPAGTNLVETLNMYFMMCSIETTAEQMSLVAATLANGGVCPVTGRCVFSSSTVRDAMSLMTSCGMYDYSGEFAFSVGLPSKSGVAGSLMVVVPNVAGFCVWSPRLDQFGNSVRGVEFCRLMSQRYQFHTFDNSGDQSVEKINPRLAQSASVEDDLVNLLFAAAVGDLHRVKQLAARGCSLEYEDYDGRTALHLAASNGHRSIAEYLIDKGVSLSPRDRFQNTPRNDAERHGHLVIADLLKKAEAQQSILENPKNNESPMIASQGVAACPNNGPSLESAENHDDTAHESAVDQDPDDEDDQAVSMGLDLLFSSFETDKSGHGSFKKVCERFTVSGIDVDRDPRLRGKFSLPESFTESDFYKAMGACSPSTASLVRRTLDGSLMVPDFPSLSEDLASVFCESSEVSIGDAANASYIPELAAVPSDLFGCAVCTVDGQRAYFGSALAPFTAQHCSNALSYCAALEQRGEKVVHSRMGREPSGSVGNHLLLNHRDLPHNPFTNAGAMAALSLVCPDDALPDRYDYMMKLYRRAVGNPDSGDDHDLVGFNLAVFLSEEQNSDRNRCLTYHMREKNALPKGTNLEEVLQFYLMMCSLEWNCASMSLIAATLASGGVCPLTGERIFSSSTVRSCLSIMSSCGMYDYSGEWAFLVGLPAVAGASGSVMLIVPGVMGIALYSPPLNASRISVRGIDFARRLADMYAFHPFESNTQGFTLKKNPCLWRLTSLHRDIYAVCTAAAKDDVSEVRRLLARKVDINMGDYDGRTALHLAASSGHLEIVRILMHAGADPNSRDRWGSTPIDDASRQGFQRCILLMKATKSDGGLSLDTAPKFSFGGPVSGSAILSTSPRSPAVQDSFNNGRSGPSTRRTAS